MRSFLFRFASVHLKNWHIVASVLFALMAGTYSLKNRQNKNKQENKKTKVKRDKKRKKQKKRKIYIYIGAKK